MVPDEKLAAERVGLGVELLAGYIPDWYKLINTEILNMANWEFCILGQIFEDYYIGRNIIGLGDYETSIDYGFAGTTKTYDPIEYRRELAEHWLNAIDAGRAKENL